MGCASSRPQVDAATSSVVVQPVPDKPGLDDAHKPVQQRKRDIFDVEVVQKDQQRAVAKQETPVMHQVKGILQQLLLISAEGPAACDVAVSIVQTGLKDVAAASLAACSNKPGMAVLVSAHGAGATLLQNQLVVSGTEWSASLAASKAAGGQSNHAVLYRTAATPDAADSLPKDWHQLYHEAGLRTFMAVPITANGATLGVMGLSSTAVGAFKESWWEPLLSILCTGMVPLLRSSLMIGLVELIIAIYQTQHAYGFAVTVIQGACSLLQSYTNMNLGVRLGLLSPDGQQVLIMNNRRTSNSTGSSRDRLPASKQTASLIRGDIIEVADDELSLHRLTANNTLLKDAVDRKVARFLRNTAAYLEGVAQPSHDVFVDDEDVVSSIVVAPLVLAAGPFGGLYVTHNLPWDEGSGFTRGKAAIVALAGLLQRCLEQHVTGDRNRTWQELCDLHGRSRYRSGTFDPVTPRTSSSGTKAPGSGPALQSPTSVQGESAADHLTSQLPSSSLLKEGSTASTIIASPAGVATSSMVEMLRLQVQRSKDRQRDMQMDNDYVEELELHSLLGKGGFGSVYLGTWKGVPVAVKVMYMSQHERALMKNAMEMAVLTTIRHPNIVRVYACLTDMVEEAAPGTTPSPEVLNRRFRPVRAGAQATEGLSSLCNIVVMEVCDKGNLRQAMRKGLLHKRTANRGLVVDMRLLVTVLLEISRSIQHLHDMNLLHCDVKAENVLLKTNSGSSTGFSCKLGDFGLVKLLLGKSYFTNRSGSGTVTHLAPELFQTGTKVTSAVDSYAFGIMMFECYTCQRVYAGIGAEAIVKGVLMQQSRPQFPAGTPAAYQQLAESCWGQNKDARPNFEIIIRQLTALLDAAGGPFEPPNTDSAAYDDHGNFSATGQAEY